MEPLKAELRKVTGELGREDQIVPGITLLSGNKNGPVVQETFGFKSLAPDAVPLDLNTTIWVASCTKLMTTVAALQCVERGLVELDEDITRVLHEWKEPKILTGFDENGMPITKVAKNKMTLRQLLTHSAGMGYGFANQDLQRYRQATGHKSPSWGPADSIMDVYFDPLLYEPGEGWTYSTSIDWAGVVVERVGGCGRLQEYMDKNIWNPLGMKAITFRPDERQDISSSMMQMLIRDNNGGLTTSKTTMDTSNFKFDAGGAGLFLQPTEFTKLLCSLLRNDEIVLKGESVDMMFTPQLPDAKYLRAFMDSNPLSYSLLRGLPLSIKYNWGFGGIVTQEDVPGRRRSGSLMWGGLPNCSWIDRKSDLYALFATQVLPTGDRQSLKLAIKFENVLYPETETA